MKILEFQHYIKYGKDENGRTINDAYTALVKGKATCTGFAEAFNFLASCINMESVEIGNPGVHSWNGVKVCGNWFEVEPQSKNNPSVNDATRNINMTEVLRGSEYMSNIDRAHQEGDKRDTLPVSMIDYMDYKDPSRLQVTSSSGMVPRQPSTEHAVIVANTKMTVLNIMKKLLLSYGR